MSNNEPIQVKSVMTRGVQGIPLGTDLTHVVERLLENNITGLPVVAADGKVVGFVSEQDCLRTLLVSSYHCEGLPVVDDVMFSKPLTVKLADSVVDVAELMVKEKPKIYPVVDDFGILQGILTRGQVLAVLKDSRRHCDVG